MLHRLIQNVHVKIDGVADKDDCIPERYGKSGHSGNPVFKLEGAALKKSGMDLMIFIRNYRILILIGHRRKAPLCGKKNFSFTSFRGKAETNQYFGVFSRVNNPIPCEMVRRCVRNRTFALRKIKIGSTFLGSWSLDPVQKARRDCSSACRPSVGRPIIRKRWRR